MGHRERTDVSERSKISFSCRKLDQIFSLAYTAVLVPYRLNPHALHVGSKVRLALIHVS